MADPGWLVSNSIAGYAGLCSVVLQDGWPRLACVQEYCWMCVLGWLVFSCMTADLGWLVFSSTVRWLAQCWLIFSSIVG